MRFNAILLSASVTAVVISGQRETQARSWVEEVDPASTDSSNDESSEPESRAPSNSDDDFNTPKPGYKLETGFRWGLLIAGATVETIFYGLSVGAAVSNPELRYLAVPLAGPWIVLATTPSGEKDCHETCMAALGGQGVVVIDGLAQATGAVLITAALTNPIKRWVPTGSTAFGIVPMVRRDLAGAMVQGTF